MNVNLFSNKPKVANRVLSVQEALQLKHFSALHEGNPTTGSWLNGCKDDPLKGTLFVKNVHHQLIRCGNENIDFNFMEVMFPNAGLTKPDLIGTKRWFNRYMGDRNWNVWFVSSVTGSAPGADADVTLIRSLHSENGKSSPLAEGTSIHDVENHRFYRVVKKNTENDYAHKLTLRAEDRAPISIKANKPYLMVMANKQGGCGCANPINSINTLGIVNEINPMKVRSDWRICIDVLTGYPDKLQYGITFDHNGQMHDAWHIKEMQDARINVRAAINIAAFNGTPITNEALLTEGNAHSVDDNHKGFYGFIPSIKWGGGQRYKFPAHAGFDMESDGDAILLYNKSLGRGSKYLVKHGAAWGMSLVGRQNLVVQQQTPFTDWEAYRRYAEYSGDADISTAIAKLGITSYMYKGLKLDFKEVASFADSRYIGRDYLNNLAIFIPAGNEIKDADGNRKAPIEFNTYSGGNGWTGTYEEYFVDERYQKDQCNFLSGGSVESVAMTVHCTNQFILAEGQRVS